jgi:hypothetical protein
VSDRLIADNDDNDGVEETKASQQSKTVAASNSNKTIIEKGEKKYKNKLDVSDVMLVWTLRYSYG